MAKRAEAERKKDMLNYHLPTMASTWFVHKDDLMQFANSASVPDSIRAGLFELSEQYRDPSTIEVALAPNADAAQEIAHNLAPAEAVANDDPLPLSTSDVAFCFDGLYFNEEGWKR